MNLCSGYTPRGFYESFKKQGGTHTTYYRYRETEPPTEDEKKYFSI